MSESKILTEESHSVQTHISIMQNIIERMANNSNSAKTWCITIVSAILVVVAEKENTQYIYLALFPTFLFMFIDAYYLALEKGFRKSYNNFIIKLHNEVLTTDDLFSVLPDMDDEKFNIKSMLSFSVYGFYIGISLIIILFKEIM